MIAAKRAMRAGQLADHIARVLAEPPALTADQRAELVALIQDGGAA